MKLEKYSSFMSLVSVFSSVTEFWLFQHICAKILAIIQQKMDWGYYSETKIQFHEELQLKNTFRFHGNRIYANGTDLDFYMINDCKLRSIPQYYLKNVFCHYNNSNSVFSLRLHQMRWYFLDFQMYASKMCRCLLVFPYFSNNQFSSSDRPT